MERVVTDKSFTMAEILISLTIIGVIAAITLPSLRANINEKTWATQRKVLNSRLSQAISMMPSLNGYGIGTTSALTEQNAAQAFITEGLSKVLQIKNICNYENLSKCNIPNKISRLKSKKKIDFPNRLNALNGNWPVAHTTTLEGVTYNFRSIFNTFVSAFETQNGESIAVYYYPNCQSKNKSINYYVQTMICANFLYDLNGKKGPNKVGKDIGFITALYATDSELISPQAAQASSAMIIGFDSAKQFCSNQGTRMANSEEFMSLFANSKLIGYNDQVGYFTSDKFNGNNVFILSSTGLLYSENKNRAYVQCIKR